MQETAYQLRVPRASSAQLLYLGGFALLIVHSASLLLRRSTSRSTRVAAALLAGEALFVSHWLMHPLLFPSYDDLLHLTSLQQLVDGRRFLTPNPLLPVSPYYPGLELFTAGIHWTTGLPTLPSQIAVILLARALLLSTLFLVAERLAHSHYAGGAAVLLYIANPQFYTFDAQYAYETLALSLALATVYYGLRAADAPEGKPAPAYPARHALPTSSRRLQRALRNWPFTLSERRRALLIAGGALLLLAVTHHVVSWVTLGALGATGAWLAIIGSRHAARIFLTLTTWGAIVIGGWTILAANQLHTYIVPLVQESVQSIADIILHRKPPHQLFQQSTTYHAPPWQEALILAAAALWAVLLAYAFLSRSGRPTFRNNRALWLLGAADAGYPFLLLSHFSPTAVQFGTRASALLFLCMSCTVAIWWVRSRPHHPLAVVALTSPVLVVLFIGGLLLGTGPPSTTLPGPYLVEADARSMDSYSVAAANWAQNHLPPGTRLAADRDNSALMAAIGRLTPVTQIGGSVDVAPLYFSDTVGPSQVAMVRAARIRLLLVDRRLASGLPYVGVYFEPGETYNPATRSEEVRRLNLEELDKFQHWQDARLIYHNGPIEIFDLSRVLHLQPLATARHRATGDALQRADWPITGAVVLLLAYSALTRRRPRHNRPDVARHLTALVLTTVILLAAFATLAVAIPGPVPYMSGGLLLALFARSRPWSRHWRARVNWRRLCTGSVAFAASASLITSATVVVAIVAALE